VLIGVLFVIAQVGQHHEIHRTQNFDVVGNPSRAITSYVHRVAKDFVLRLEEEDFKNVHYLA
jgi:hypothetical protein